MNILKLSLSVISLAAIVACSTDDTITQNNQQPTSDVTNKDQGLDQFIWNGMNQVYLYKEDVPKLANDAFANTTELNKFLATFTSPEELYANLQSQQDRFSFLTDNYVQLEQSFSGVSKSNGMDFSLALVSQGSDDVIGFVRYVLPGTDAEAKGVVRGDIFNTINGEKLTRSSDFNTLFGLTTYTIGLASVDSNGNVTSRNQEISLTQSEYTENPVYISKVIEYQGQKIGYVMYNSFVGDFDAQLNTAFGDLKAAGINDLILDLRYNGGGSVRTAIDLSAMITGQFTGDIFSKEIWNKELQAAFNAQDPERLINRFRDTIRTGAPINSLNLSRVYILTTDRSASASELVINGLDPYIETKKIGDTTTGKFQASITLYDSDNFGREGASTEHTYAIQPLVLKSANKVGKTDYVNGLAPDVNFKEKISNLGILGEPTEPFLNAALEYIVNGVLPADPNAKRKNGFIEEMEILGESNMFNPTYQRMYIDHDKVDFIR
ncbi:S41 family peptidase [Aquimarina sp. 2-A2]|uniref:S41 family peptidase n=1 Tax=Aquimarina sp. 2-A2 TaxID=3382644 RepID=UPI00387F10A7